MDSKAAFSKYVEDVGGREAAAKELGITVGMVGHVLNGIRNLSVERCRMIEDRTDGRISRDMLRPDIFGGYGNAA